jgi:membrane protease YdiL (CAAX protease family)
MSAQPLRSEAPAYPLPRSIGLVAAAALLGLATHVVAESLGWHFPSFGYAAGIIIWKLGTLGLLVLAVRRFEGRRVTAEDIGLGAALSKTERRARGRVTIVGLLASGAAALVLSKISAISSSNASVYGVTTKASVALIVFELAVVYPLTVFAEEAFFRGFVHPRLLWAPPVLSGVLWSAYHLQQARTIPSLIPLGIALGLIRWWRGNVKATGVLHYAADASFFIANYT